METTDEHPRGALHAYLDRELSLEGSLEVEHHLSECAACQRELDTYRALRRLLQSAKATAPEAETALLRVTRTVRLRHRRRTFVVGGAMAMAAAAVAVFALVPGRNDSIVREVAAVHARALEASSTDCPLSSARACTDATSCTTPSFSFGTTISATSAAAAIAPNPPTA